MDLQIMPALQTGETPGPVSSLLKLRVGEIRQAVTALGVELVGGTPEIQRDIIARTMLGP